MWYPPNSLCYPETHCSCIGHVYSVLYAPVASSDSGWFVLPNRAGSHQGVHRYAGLCTVWQANERVVPCPAQDRIVICRCCLKVQNPSWYLIHLHIAEQATEMIVSWP